MGEEGANWVLLVGGGGVEAGSVLLCIIMCSRDGEESILKLSGKGNLN